MTGNQLQAARVLLGWSQADLARASGLSIPTVKRAEGNSAIGASAQATATMRRALEQAGVEFLDVRGVRLREAVPEPEPEPEAQVEEDLEERDLFI